MIRFNEWLRSKFMWLTILIMMTIINTNCITRQTYHNSLKGFSIQHPTNWSVDASDQSDTVALGGQVHINVYPDDMLLVNDLFSHLEAMTEANLESGIFVEVGQPELIRLHDYQAARISTIAKTKPRLISVPLGLSKEPEWVFDDVPTDIIVVTDGVRVAIIFVVLPDETTEWVVESFRFCCN